MADIAKTVKKPTASAAVHNGKNKTPKVAEKQQQQQHQQQQQQPKAAAASNGTGHDEEVNGAITDMLASHERELLEVASELTAETTHYDNELRCLKEKLEAANRRLMQLEWRFPTSATWRIGDFLERFKEAKKKGAMLESPQYYLTRQGYRFSMSISLNGFGEARGKYISLYVSLCKGEFDGNLSWPFAMRLYLTILDQTDDELPRQNLTKVIIPRACRENLAFLGRPKVSRNPHFGLDQFASLEDVLRSGRHYVRNDAIFVRLETPGEDLQPL